MKTPLGGITYNGQDINIYLKRESILDVLDIIKEHQHEVTLYYTPAKNKNWKPRYCRSSRVRKLRPEDL